MSFRPLRTPQPGREFQQFEFPTVITVSITNVTSSTADGNGNVTVAGGSAVTVRGFVWSSTTTVPTLADNSGSSGSGLGTYTVNISGLSPSTLYYARAYATNVAGTSYGDVVTFTTTSAVGAFRPHYLGALGAGA